MSELDHLRKHSLMCMRLAADCTQLAADTHRPAWQAHFFRMANEWRSLAEIGPRAETPNKELN
jgi:hypothetical protein